MIIELFLKGDAYFVQAQMYINLNTHVHTT